jgi:hypothetical protein
MARVRDNASAGNLVIEGADGVGEALIESQKSRSRTARWRNPPRASAPRSTTGEQAAARNVRRILELEQQGAMSLRGVSPSASRRPPNIGSCYSAFILRMTSSTWLPGTGLE